MTKQEFTKKLREKLRALPEQAVDERIDFYSEIIDDRVEDGLSEDDAVSGIGDVDAIADHIISDFSASKPTKEVKKQKRLNAVRII